MEDKAPTRGELPVSVGKKGHRSRPDFLSQIFKKFQLQLMVKAFKRNFVRAASPSLEKKGKLKNLKGS